MLLKFGGPLGLTVTELPVEEPECILQKEASSAVLLEAS